MKAVLEMFGSITEEQLRRENVKLYHVAIDALEALDNQVGLERIDTVVTGMTHREERPVTNALQGAEATLDEADFDVEVDFIKVTDLMDEDEDLEYDEAWQNAINLRNEKHFTPAGEEPEGVEEAEQADIAIVVGDAGNSGNAMLDLAEEHGVTPQKINVDHVLEDLDAVYGGNEEEEEASA